MEDRGDEKHREGRRKEQTKKAVHARKGSGGEASGARRAASRRTGSEEEGEGGREKFDEAGIQSESKMKRRGRDG